MIGVPSSIASSTIPALSGKCKKIIFFIKSILIFLFILNFTSHKVQTFNHFLKLLTSLLIQHSLTNVNNVYSFIRLLSEVLDANNLPGSICSLVQGGADVGYVTF